MLHEIFLEFDRVSYQYKVVYLESEEMDSIVRELYYNGTVLQRKMLLMYHAKISLFGNIDRQHVFFCI